MSSVESPESVESQRYVDFDEYVEFQLKKTRTNIKQTDILVALAGSAALVGAYLLLFVVLDHWVVPGGFGVVTRLVMLVSLLSAIAGWLIWRVIIPSTRNVNELYAAKQIETAVPSLKQSLFNLIDLQHSARPISGSIMETLTRQSATTLSHTNVDHAVDHRSLMRTSYALLAVVVLGCLYVLLTPKQVGPAIWRALLPIADVDAATQTRIVNISPGEDVERLVGSQLEIGVDLLGQRPSDVTLFYTTSDRRYVDEQLTLQQPDPEVMHYEALLTGDNGRGIMQDLSYYIVAGDARSDTFRVRVLQPPSAQVERVSYRYPDYMRLEPRTTAGGAIDAWEGTTVTVTAQANMPVRSAILQFADELGEFGKAEEFLMDITDEVHLRASWELTIREDGSTPKQYRIVCKNEDGLADPEPATYPIEIRRDQPPVVELLDPVNDLQKPANAIIPLLIRASDPDFALRFVALRVEKNSDLIQSEPIFEGERENFQGTYEFHLDRLKLTPGEVISFWIEARDNKQPLGNRKNTPHLNVQIIEPVTPEKAREELEQEKEQQQDKFPPEMSAEQTPGDSGEQITERPRPGDEGDSSANDSTASGDKDGEQADGKQPEESADGKEPADDKSSEQGNSPSTKPGEQPGKQQQPKTTPNDGSEDDSVLEKLFRIIQDEKQAAGENDGGSDKQPGEKANDGSENSGNMTQPGGEQGNQPGEQGAQGSPTDSNNADTPNEPQPRGTGQPGEKMSPDGVAKPGEGDANGPRESVDDAPDAVQRKGSGNTTGTGKPGDPNADSTPAQQKIERKPGTEPVMKPSGSDPTKGINESVDPNAMQPGPGKPSSQQPSGQQPSGQQPSGQQPSGQQPSGQQPSGQQPSGQQPSGQQPSGQQPSGQQPSGQQPSGQQPSGQQPSGQQPSGQQPSGQQPSGQQPSGQQPSGQQPSGQQPSGQQPGGQQPGGQQPGGQQPGGQQPGGQQPGGQQPGGQQPGGQQPGGQQPGGQQPGGQQPGGQQPGGQQPGGQQPGGQQPGGQQPGGQQPGGQQPGGQQPGGQQPGGQQPGGQQPGGQQPGGQQPGGQQPGGQQPGGQQPGGQQPGGQQPGGQQPGGQQPGTEGGSGAGKESSTGAGGMPSGRNTVAGENEGPVVGDGGSNGGANSAEAADLEFAKKAANLVLKELQDDLERGEVSPELLEELGWTKEDMQRFSQRLSERLQQAKQAGETPEEFVRRRQFEEMLKNLDLSAGKSSRRTAKSKAHEVEGVGPRRTPVPPEYREQYEGYTRSLSRRAKQPASSK